MLCMFYLPIIYLFIYNNAPYFLEAKASLQIASESHQLSKEVSNQKVGNKWGLSCAKLRAIAICLIWCKICYFSAQQNLYFSCVG